MKTLKINNTDLDVHDGTIGIACSGGADSAILLYLIMLYCPGPIHVYTLANKVKQRTNPKVAYNVICKLLDITNRQDVTHHVFFAEKQTFDTLFNPLQKQLEYNNIDVIYTAGTALPPDAELKKFSSDNGLYDKRNANTVRPLYNGITKKFYSPWWNKDKKFIKQIYDLYNMNEILFPITRSCEDPTIIEGHCGKCWWCEERLWAFGSL